MKNFRTKFLIALLSFIVGISAFYFSPNIRSFITSQSSLSEKNLPNKMEIRFVKFVQGDFQVEAEFKVTNNSAENVYYSSSSKNSYPFPTLKRDGKVLPDNRFRCGTGHTEQTLSPQETVFFRVPKWEVNDEPTQIGFSFEIGNKPFIRIGNNPRETFWSEEIKFP